MDWDYFDRLTLRFGAFFRFESERGILAVGFTLRIAATNLSFRIGMRIFSGLGIFESYLNLVVSSVC